MWKLSASPLYTLTLSLQFGLQLCPIAALLLPMIFLMTFLALRLPVIRAFYATVMALILMLIGMTMMVLRDAVIALEWLLTMLATWGWAWRLLLLRLPLRVRVRLLRMVLWLRR